MLQTSKIEQSAIDNIGNLCYNTDMKNNNNNNERRNQMIEKLEATFIIISCLSAMAACAIGGAFWLISDIM